MMHENVIDILIDGSEPSPLIQRGKLRILKGETDIPLDKIRRKTWARNVYAIPGGNHVQFSDGPNGTNIRHYYGYMKVQAPVDYRNDEYDPGDLVSARTSAIGIPNWKPTEEDLAATDWVLYEEP